MKAKIKKYTDGLLGDGHTPYRLELHAEIDEDRIILKELNQNLVVFVSPNGSENKMTWWGKK